MIFFSSGKNPPNKIRLNQINDFPRNDRHFFNWHAIEWHMSRGKRKSKIYRNQHRKPRPNAQAFEFKWNILTYNAFNYCVALFICAEQNSLRTRKMAKIPNRAKPQPLQATNHLEQFNCIHCTYAFHTIGVRFAYFSVFASSRAARSLRETRARTWIRLVLSVVALRPPLLGVCVARSLYMFPVYLLIFLFCLCVRWLVYHSIQCICMFITEYLLGGNPKRWAKYTLIIPNFG